MWYVYKWFLLILCKDLSYFRLRYLSYFLLIQGQNDSRHFWRSVPYRTYNRTKTKKEILPSMAHIKISATMATPRKLHIKPMKYIIHRVHNGIFVSSISGNTYPYLVSRSFGQFLMAKGLDWGEFHFRSLNIKEFDAYFNNDIFNHLKWNWSE